jgi:outer membrane protein TolC
MKRRADIYCFALMLLPAVAAAQSTNITLTERLSLERALHLALENNRQIQNAVLQVQKASEDIGIARSHRLPVFDIEGQASQLLTPVDFAFPQGAFGEFAASDRFRRRIPTSACRGS